MSDPPLTPQQIAEAEVRAAKEGYIHHWFDALDDLGAATFGIQNDQTISSATEIGAHKKVWYSAFARALNDGLDLIQKSHGQLAQAGDIERARKVLATDAAALAQETATK